MKTIIPHKQFGGSIIVVLSVLATLMVIVGVAAEYTWTINRHVQRSNTKQNAIAVADASIEILFANWRKTCSDPLKVRTALTTDHFDGTIGTAIPTPSPGQLNLPPVTNFVKRGISIDPNDEATDYDPNYTISNYKVIAVTPEWTTLATAATTPMPMRGQVASSPSPAPTPSTTMVYNYIASADVTLPALGPTGKVVAKVRRVFQKQQMSPWNFAIFYIDPLEIHPGADFTVTGWVHTNSDLYTGHNLLTFADKVTYGSDWFTDFMTPAANPRTWVDGAGVTQYAVPAPGDTTHPETPTAPNYPGNLPPANDKALQPFGLDASLLFNLTDANPNNDSYRELIEPPTATPDPLSNPRYWDEADVVIQISDSPSPNTVKIGKPHFNTTTQRYDGTIDALTSSSPGPDGDLYDMFITSGSITTTTDSSKEVQDDREGAKIRLVTLDLRKVLDFPSNNTSGLIPTYKAPNFKGIVYIYDNSATTHSLNSNGSVNPSVTGTKKRRGIRLKNGNKIPAMGLTVVSPNPVYIQGDYNTGRDYDGSPQPPSNNSTSDPALPQVAGYTRAPCSVLADAVTILSNSWDDTKAGTTPTASNTTINTAIISGIVPTNAYGTGNYSGGAENFPRFLESWSNKAFTYYGSMVQLYKSQQSIAPWQYEGVYEAPERQWYFDNNFKTKPPPGSLMLYSYIKGKWSVTLTLLLSGAFCIGIARADLLLMPKVAVYKADGATMTRFEFTDGSKTVTYQAPRGWDYSGSSTQLTLRPPNKTQAEATITRDPLSQPGTFDEASLSKLVSDAVARVPEGSENVSVVSQERNPLMIQLEETFLITLSYTFYGQKFNRSILLLNRGSEQMRFQLTCHESDFEELHRAFLRSQYTWQNL